MLAQGRAQVHRDVTVQGKRGEGPGRVDRERQPAYGHDQAGGSPNRFASAGARGKGPFRPVCTSVKEPSGFPQNFPGPFIFSVMVFPVCTFVSVAEGGR